MQFNLLKSLQQVKNKVLGSVLSLDWKNVMKDFTDNLHLAHICVGLPISLKLHMTAIMYPRLEGRWVLLRERIKCAARRLPTQSLLGSGSSTELMMFRVMCLLLTWLNVFHLTRVSPVIFTNSIRNGYGNSLISIWQINTIMFHSFSNVMLLHINALYKSVFFPAIPMLIARKNHKVNCDEYVVRLIQWIYLELCCLSSSCYQDRIPTLSCILIILDHYKSIITLKCKSSGSSTHLEYIGQYVIWNIY